MPLNQAMTGSSPSPPGPAYRDASFLRIAGVRPTRREVSRQRKSRAAPGSWRPRPARGGLRHAAAPPDMRYVALSLSRPVGLSGDRKAACARGGLPARGSAFRPEGGGPAAALVIDGGGSNRMTIHGTVVIGRIRRQANARSATRSRPTFSLAAAFARGRQVAADARQRMPETIRVASLLGE